MKIGNLIDSNFQNALSKLMTQPLALKVTYKLYNIKKTTEDEFAKYDKIRLDAIARLSEKNADGTPTSDEKGNAQFSPDNLASFAQELNEFLDVEFTHDKVKLEELGESLKLSVQELAALSPILDL